MMRGVLPSITATAELVVPKSIPITEPLTFSPESSAYLRTNDERRGDVRAGTRWKAEVARGKNYDAVSVGPRTAACVDLRIAISSRTTWLRVCGECLRREGAAGDRRVQGEGGLDGGGGGGVFMMEESTGGGYSSF